ncbi:hypothetical protein CARN8_5270004 [mine drainage metagenome]|uniref:Uncharacterized protein n=1 Tax=mine drainage metagenome TaxID=410659 RepID=A0A3P3ZQQ5_9ZZZZ
MAISIPNHKTKLKQNEKASFIDEFQKQSFSINHNNRLYFTFAKPVHTKQPWEQIFKTPKSINFYPIQFDYGEDTLVPPNYPFHPLIIHR